MELVKGANEKARELLAAKITVEFYDSMVESAINKKEAVFSTAFQNYVTRLGLILAQCVEGGELSANTYLGSIDFICVQVIGSTQRKKLMKAIEVNDLANFGKHSLNSASISIEECIHQLNGMVRSLIEATGLDAFSVAYVDLEKKSEPKRVENTGGGPIGLGVLEGQAEVKKKPIDKLKREPSHSYGSVGGVRYEFAFLEEYDVDPYFRKVKARIDLVLPDAASDKELTVVFKTKGGGELQRLDRIALTTPDKYCFEVTMSENELVAGKVAVVAELLVEQVSRVGLLKKAVYSELAVAKVELSRKLDV